MSGSSFESGSYVPLSQVLKAMVPPSRKRPAPEPEKNFDLMSVAELRAECTRRGLVSSGAKAVLLTRLRDAGSD